ncbi:MAG TPA: HAMP domain-containing sensor histidine kinase [Bacteroidales bacterium]
MKIKYRLTLFFSLLVAGILIIFSVSVYAFYLKHHQNEFVSRLKTRAINTATLLNTEPFDANTMKIIDHTSVSNLEDLTVIVLDSAGSFLYSNRNVDKVNQSMPFFRMLNWQKESHQTLDKRLYISFPYDYQNSKYVLLASAFDLYGKDELNQLLTIIALVFVFSLVLIVVAGFVNAKQSLRPIKDMIRQVDEIKSENLNIILQTRNKDEIAELANTFNNMLERLRLAFEREKFFVSNASHELRTPLTSMKGQIEVALLKDRKTADYAKVLESLLGDVENMIQIINGFLQLAETNVDPSSLQLRKIRADELLFAVKDDIQKLKPSYHINITFEKTPEQENDISFSGNDGLLWIMFSNLIDNACKFSGDNKSTVSIDFDDSFTIIRVIDNGLGIPGEEIHYVTQPLYRASNVKKVRGHGLGLSIVQRIAEMHKATIGFESELNRGTTVTIRFPKI